VDFSSLIQLAKAHATAELSSASEVASANGAADSIRAQLISALGIAEQRVELMTLLSNQYIGAWIAFVGIESGLLDSSQARECLARIRQIAAGSTLDGIGARAWLSKLGSDA
jgi:hypothetical protein